MKRVCTLFGTLIVILITFVSQLPAQELLPGPNGGPIEQTDIKRLRRDTTKPYAKLLPSGLVHGAHTASIYFDDDAVGDDREVFRDADKDGKIIDVSMCFASDTIVKNVTEKFVYWLYVLVQRGDEQFLQTVKVTIIRMENGIPVFATKSKVLGEVGPIKEKRTRLDGDDVYALGSNSVLVTRDTGATWQYDTLGLNGANLNALALDSSYNPFLATSSGLYHQGMHSSTWLPCAALAGKDVLSVFIDVNNRIFCLVDGILQISTDYATSFHADTSGLGTTGTVTSMSTDDVGNVYLLMNGARLYKRSVGQNTWKNISQQFNSIKRYLNPYVPAFTAVGTNGNTIILASSFGFICSTDEGASWKYCGNAPCEVMYGFVQNDAQRRFVSNDRGLFYTNIKDSVWQQCFPATAFIGAIDVFHLPDHSMYISGGYRASTSSASSYYIWKSNDDGQTWQPDTVGLGPFDFTTLFVDSSGNQYACSYAKAWYKAKGGSWVRDSLGLDSLNGLYGYSVDHHGNVYLANYSSTGTKLYRRAIGTTVWHADTVGLAQNCPKNAFLYRIHEEANGTQWAMTYNNGLMWRANLSSPWSQAPSPPGLNTAYNQCCFVATSDASGNLWTQWTFYNEINHAIGEGVFYTSDHGTTWTAVPFDTITFRKLVAVGDTVYGLSYFNGLYLFKASKVVNDVNTMLTESLSTNINPNPANSTLHIVFNNTCVQELQLYRMNGSLVNKYQVNGLSDFLMDCSALQADEYFIRIISATRTEVQRFVKY